MIKDEFVKSDNANYLINKKTNMVINSNESELLTYRSQVAQVLEIKSLHADFDTVNRELSELKILLTRLLNSK